MAKEIMERKAADNKYLHKDFHIHMNLGIEYLREHFGDVAVRAYLRQFALAYHAPLTASLKEKGLTAIQEYTQRIYREEEAEGDVSFSLSPDKLMIRVEKCPAAAHMKKAGITVSPLYDETIKAVNQGICEGTPFAFALLSYDAETGASVQCFYRKEA